MKKFILFGLIFLAFASSAVAEVASIKVCNAKTLASGAATDCTYTDISKYKFFSYQVYCGETTGDSMSIHIDWIGGSAAGTAYMGIPLLTGTTAMTQLRTAYTTEDAWSVLQSIEPPASPIGTIRLTENNSDADIVCTVILNMGD